MHIEYIVVSKSFVNYNYFSCLLYYYELTTHGILYCITICANSNLCKILRIISF